MGLSETVAIVGLMSALFIVGTIIGEERVKISSDKIQHAQEVCPSNEGIKHLTHNKIVCNNSSSFEYK